MFSVYIGKSYLLGFRNTEKICEKQQHCFASLLKRYVVVALCGVTHCYKHKLFDLNFGYYYLQHCQIIKYKLIHYKYKNKEMNMVS